VPDLRDLIKHINKLKSFKHWMVKDTTYFKKEIGGTHWFLKKYIVLYKDILVTKNKINKNTLEKIRINFENFCNSVRNLEEKKESYNYFFNPTDLRIENCILDFDYFNNIKEKEDNARKFFMMRILGGGGQAGGKKKIWELMLQKLTYKEIFEQAKGLVDAANKEKTVKGKEIRSASDKVSVIMSDITAQIRNYRQVFSYFGFCPHEEDGYELNQIGNLIYNCDDAVLLAAIGDHQKFKMRLGNPSLSELKSQNVNKEFIDEKDFEDYEVNPAIAIVEVLEQLIKKKINYFTLEEYKYFISRLTPFNANKAAKYILDYRNISKTKNIKNSIEKKISKSKLRTFRKTELNSSENYLKNLHNFCYGFQYEKGNKIFDKISFIKYHSGKLEVTNEKKFEYYCHFLKHIKTELNNKYSKLYLEFSKSYKLNMIRDIASTSDIDSILKDKIVKIRKAIIGDKELKIYDFYNQCEIDWKDYLNEIDYDILILCYVLNLSVINYEDIINDFDLFKKNYQLPTFIKSFFGDITDKIFELIDIYFKKTEKTPENILKNLNSETLDKFSSTSSSVSYSADIESSKKEERDNLIFYNKKTVKRNYKMMNFVRSQRSKGFFFGKINKLHNPKNCDVCNVEKKLDCHHIIDFEIGGPDIDLNYAFLCSDCHKLFSFKTSKPKEKKFAINTLRLKKLVSINNFYELIRNNYIKAKHLKFLFYSKYIHLVEYLDLTSKLNINNRDFLDKVDFSKSKLGISALRWNRAMRAVYYYRKRHNYIVDEQNFNYEIDKCDGGCGSVLEDTNIECHHIIPKKMKFQRHNDIELEGPESPYNYAYLCKNCHKTFTYDVIPDQKKIINNFRKNNLISEENIKRMIICDNININHLNFLFVDSYINKIEFENLKIILEKRDYYRSI